MQGCGAGLAGVVSVLTFGASKYAPNSWQTVENGQTRYMDALYRHLNSIATEGLRSKDAESGLLHIYHVACNALFLCYFATKKTRK